MVKEEGIVSYVSLSRNVDEKIRSLYQTEGF